MRDNSEYLAAPEHVVGPREMSSLISESAGLAAGALLGSGAFAALAWVASDVAWLHAVSVVLAVLLGLCGLRHVLFLVRAGLLFRDELDRTAEWIEREDGDV